MSSLYIIATALAAALVAGGAAWQQFAPVVARRRVAEHSAEIARITAGWAAAEASSPVVGEIRPGRYRRKRRAPSRRWSGIRKWLSEPAWGRNEPDGPAIPARRALASRARTAPASRPSLALVYGWSAT